MQKLELLGYDKSFNEFLKVVEEKFGTEKAYFEAYNKVKENAISSIKERQEFLEFNESDMTKYPHYEINRPKDSIYKKRNLKKVLLSVDLSSANFQALRYVNPIIVGGEPEYYDFISQFTEMEHVKRSKYVRQVIFGSLNNQKKPIIEVVEKHLIGKMIPAVLRQLGGDELINKEKLNKPMDEENVLLLYSNDEIVFDITNMSEDKYEALIENVNTEARGLNIKVKSEIFNLTNFEQVIKRGEEEIISNTDFYVKNFIAGKNKGTYVYKGLDSDSYSLAYCCHNGIAIPSHAKIIYNGRFICEIKDDVSYRLTNNDKGEEETNEKDINGN